VQVGKLANELGEKDKIHRATLMKTWLTGEAPKAPSGREERRGAAFGSSYSGLDTGERNWAVRTIYGITSLMSLQSGESAMFNLMSV